MLQLAGSSPDKCEPLQAEACDTRHTSAGSIPNPSLRGLFAVERLGLSGVNRKRWGYDYEFLSEGVQFLGREGAEKGLQKDGRLPHARIEVITKDFHLLPGRIGKLGGSIGNAGNDGSRFRLQFSDDFTEGI